jgi:peptidyl-prolyl cis-trans isomerase A (cyclophilin A)
LEGGNSRAYAHNKGEGMKIRYYEVTFIAAGVLLLASNAAMAGGNAASNSSQKGTMSMSSDPALMTPSKLSEQAPASFDAKFVTTKGDFTVHVTRSWAPLGADRFYNLVKHGFFDDCTLFRVVNGFVVQFGINGNPKIATAWTHANIKDDPGKASNTKGMITFAMAGPNTRTTQVFINLGNNAALDSQGFSPFGQVTQGMSVVESLYSGYADQPTSHQGEITMQGSAYLKQNYPKLDVIKSATIAGAPAAHHSAAHTPAKTQ